MVETTCMFMDRYNTGTKCYIHNGILFSLKKEWNPDTWYNMGEPWKYYAKLDKSDTKRKKIV